jgi:hypothetical protein
MMDNTNPLQQQAVGVLGVNLIHAAYFHRESQADFLASLVDGLTLDRIEIDHLDLEGPAFEGFDDDLGLALVTSGLAHAVAWAPGVETRDPMSAIYGRPVVIQRGSFVEVGPSNEALMEAALSRLGDEASESKRPPLGVYELSLANPAAKEPLSVGEAERRVSALRSLGRPVLLSTLPENYHVTSFLKRFSQEPIRFAAGLTNVVHVFHEAYYTALDGGVLEAFARLLSTNVRLYVFPEPVESIRATVEGLEDGPNLWSLPEEGVATLENTEPTTRLRHLYRYMRETGTLVTVTTS